MLCWQIYLTALMAGILASNDVWAALAVPLVGLLLAWDRLGSSAPRCLAVLSFCAGLGLGLLHAPDTGAPIPQWMLARQPVQVSGTITETEGRYGQSLRMVLRDVHVRPVDQTIEAEGSEHPDHLHSQTLDAAPPYDPGIEKLPMDLVWTWYYPAFHPKPGSRVSFQTRIKPVHNLANPGGWDLESYWAQQGVAYRCYTQADSHVQASLPAPGRSRLSSLLAPDPKAMTQGQAVLLALITGDRFHINAETADLFARAGLAHVLARSGLHLGLVALWGVGLAWALCRLFPGIMLRIPRPKLAVVLAAPLVLAYALSGQPSPSLYRALAMFAAWGMLLLMNRQSVLLDGLLFALVLALMNSLFFPHSLNDLSLTLSVAAVAGIILGLQRFKPLLDKLRHSSQASGRFALASSLMAWGLALFLVSLAAQLAVLPLVVESFGRISPHLYLNLLILPLLQFFVMPLALFGWALSVVPGLDSLALWSLSIAATCLDGCIAGLSHVDTSSGLPQLILPRLGWPGWIGYWGLLLLLTMPKRTDKRSIRTHLGTGCICLGLVFLPIVQGQLASHDKTVRMTVLDVGQAQSIVLETGHGTRILMDGGGFFSRSFDSGRDLVAPFLLRKRFPRVDTVINSHPHRDHIRGLIYILEQFNVDAYFHNGRLVDDKHDAARMQALLSAPPFDVGVLKAGDVIDLGHGLSLEVLHPSPDFTVENENEQSLVLRVTKDGHGLALIPGDVEEKGLAALMERYEAEDLAAQVLVLPHHGSDTSLNPEFYEHVSPMAAVVSCGFLNAWRLPSPAVVTALQNRNTNLYTTAEHGAVSFYWPSNGELTIETSRVP